MNGSHISMPFCFYDSDVGRKGFRLVASGDDNATLGGFSADHVDTRRLFISERNAADGGLSLFLDFCFGLGRAVPVAEEEAAVLDFLLELLVVVALIYALVAVFACFLEDVVLDVFKQLFYIFNDAVH